MSRSKANNARSYQVEAIGNVVKALKKSGRTQVNMACGTGKTLVGIKACEKIAGKRNVIFAPTIGLVYQMLHSYGSQIKMDRTMIVCSDPSEAREAMEEYNIQNVTTDPEVIGAEIRKRSGDLFVFGTYKSGQRIAEAYQLAKTPAFDFAVMDEAHHLAGNDGIQKCVLFDDQVPIRKRVFMTATPRITKDSSKKNSDGSDVYSMNDESLFGKVAYCLPFSKAIKDKWLSDYQLVIIRVSEDDVLRKLNEDEDMAFVAKQAGIVKAMHKYNLRKGFVFYSSNPRARQGESCIVSMHERLKPSGQSSGILWTKNLSGKNNVKVREEVLAEMASKSSRYRCLITNCRIFGEGLDFRELDFVSINDPISSEVAVVQTIGRAIRQHPGKKIATIIVPVFVSNKDKDMDGQELMSKTGPFKAVWEVLTALRDQDDRIESFIRPRSGEGDSEARSDTTIPSNIIFDGMDDATIGSIKAKIVSFQSVQYTEDFIWEKMCEFRNSYGKWPSGRSESVPSGLHFSSWGALDKAMVCGFHGLNAGSSLCKLRKQRTGDNGTLSEDTVFQWMVDYRQKTGKWPSSGEKNDSPAPMFASWSSVNHALASGANGLPGGSSLSKLRAKMGSQSRNYTEEFIFSAMESYARANEGKYPSVHTPGKVNGTHFESWASVNDSLKSGRHGLPGGSSIRQLRNNRIRKQDVLIAANEIVKNGKKVRWYSSEIVACGFSWACINEMLSRGVLDWGATGVLDLIRQELQS